MTRNSRNDDTDKQMNRSEMDASENVRARAVEYMSYGVTQSQAKATALRDVGYSNSEVAEILGVTPDAASSYYSKFNLSLINETLRLAIAGFGGPKRVLGWNMLVDSDHEKEFWYVVKPIDSEEDIEDTRMQPQGEFVLVKIRADKKTFKSDSTVYDSLDALADDVYRNASITDEQRAHEIANMLIESGVLQNDLEDPRVKTRLE
jgi:DNA-binding CsgD family transcriptional regulator